jgi:DNA-binding XRE family transcriptional regulator
LPWSKKVVNEFIIEDAEELGPWAREVRMFHQVSSVDVGEAIDVAHNQVCAWERGAIIPGLKSAIKLASAHGYQVVLRKKGSG